MLMVFHWDWINWLNGKFLNYCKVKVMNILFQSFILIWIHNIHHFYIKGFLDYWLCWVWNMFNVLLMARLPMWEFTMWGKPFFMHYLFSIWVFVVLVTFGNNHESLVVSTWGPTVHGLVLQNSCLFMNIPCEIVTYPWRMSNFWIHTILHHMFKVVTKFASYWKLFIINVNLCHHCV